MKFRRKPQVVDAVQWTGDNMNDLIGLMNHEVCRSSAWKHGDRLHVQTIDAATSFEQMATPGAWVVRQPDGRLEIFHQVEFEALYESVPSSALPWIDTARGRGRDGN